MSSTTVASFRIFVVDDEVSSAEVVALILSEEGYQVSFAVDGRQALAALGNEEFHLLVTDYMMPAMSGAELARAARALPRQSGRLAVLMMSGAPRAALDADADAFDGFLRKPFEIRQLLQAVNTLVEQGPGPASGPLQD